MPHAPCPMTPLVQQLRNRQMPPELLDFCDRWRIEEVALFGSILRDDFADRSDVDLLVRWEPDTHWTLLDRADMKYELEALLDRRVDLVSRRAIEQSENPLRRAAILNTARTIYARPRSAISV